MRQFRPLLCYFCKSTYFFSVLYISLKILYKWRQRSSYVVVAFWHCSSTFTNVLKKNDSNLFLGLRLAIFSYWNLWTVFSQKLTNGLKSTKPSNSGSTDYSRLQFMDNDSKLVLTVGKKVFKLLDHQTFFLDQTSDWVSSLNLFYYFILFCEYKTANRTLEVIWAKK